jgi:hypothetical protein
MNLCEYLGDARALILRVHCLGVSSEIQEVPMAAKRETVQPHSGDKRYVRRDAAGKFTKDQVDVGRSLAADNNQKAKNPNPGRQGDKGDDGKRRASDARDTPSSHIRLSPGSVALEGGCATFAGPPFHWRPVTIRWTCAWVTPYRPAREDCVSPPR